MEFETPADYAWAFLKIGMAASPILIIVGMLACLREDEVDEKAKVEAAEANKSCKS